MKDVLTFFVLISFLSPECVWVRAWSDLNAAADISDSPTISHSPSSLLSSSSSPIDIDPLVTLNEPTENGSSHTTTKTSEVPDAEDALYSANADALENKSLRNTEGNAIMTTRRERNIIINPPLVRPIITSLASIRIIHNINPRLTNLLERSYPAALLLVGLYGIVRFTGDAGLRLLLLLISPGLYHEAVSVVVRQPSSSTTIFQSHWMWFVAYSFIVTLPLMPSLSTRSAIIMRFAGYCGSLMCWMSFLMILNQVQCSRDGNDIHILFASAWKEVSIYHMSALLTMVPIGCWMGLLQAGKMEWALYAALLVICNDSFAYLVGFFAGQRPLLPIISPKKTREGWIGGLVLTTLMSPILWKLLFDSSTASSSYSIHSLHVALFGSCIAPFGGFLASSLKRGQQKKDFGTLLGSHGGLIDRLDCQLVIAPYLYLYLQLIGEL